MPSLDQSLIAQLSIGSGTVAVLLWLMKRYYRDMQTGALLSGSTFQSAREDWQSTLTSMRKDCADSLAKAERREQMWYEALKIREREAELLTQQVATLLDAARVQTEVMKKLQTAVDQWASSRSS